MRWLRFGLVIFRFIDILQPIIKASIDETTRIVPLYMYNPNAFSEFMEFLTKANNMCELPLEHAESVAEAIVGENGFLRLHDFRNKWVFL